MERPILFVVVSFHDDVVVKRALLMLDGPTNADAIDDDDAHRSNER